MYQKKTNSPRHIYDRQDFTNHDMSKLKNLTFKLKLGKYSNYSIELTITMNHHFLSASVV